MMTKMRRERAVNHLRKVVADPKSRPLSQDAWHLFALGLLVCDLRTGFVAQKDLDKARLDPQMMREATDLLNEVGIPARLVN
jgi:hypothetical protein